MTKHEAIAELVVRGLAPAYALVKAFGERLTAVEARPVPLDGKDGERGEKGLDGLQGPVGEQGPEGQPGPARDGRDGLPGVPGLPGEKGADGAAGSAGVNGRDGTLENVKVIKVADRTWQLCFKNGDPVEGGALTFDGIELYRGVWSEKTYEWGDCVTWGGSEWHANETTTTKPGESKAWTLKVKQGREGRPGKDGKDGSEGKPGKNWEEVLAEKRKG